MFRIVIHSFRQAVDGTAPAVGRSTVRQFVGAEEKTRPCALWVASIKCPMTTMNFGTY
jgi:hypothetical protein